MVRLFATHRIRITSELEGLWDFEPWAGAARSFPDTYRYRLPVPGVWEMHPDFSSYRGQGVYHRSLHLHEWHNLRLQFGGVSHTADVYLDGVWQAHHYNAYTAFSTVMAKVAPGDHHLVVVVDNRFGPTSTLHVPNDYYTYGGLIRPVVLETVPEHYVEAVRFWPVLDATGWAADISVAVASLSEEARAFRIEARLGDQSLTLAQDRLAMADGVRWYTSRHRFSGIEAWSPEHPNLYDLELQLFFPEQSDPQDDLIERVGFRVVSTDSNRVQLNGQSVIFKGFNRHEDYPGVGSAIPFPLMVQDVELLRQMGANAVRTSHYPNDERFLDLCDAYGLLVWEEHHARGFDLAHMQRPGFIEQITASTEEMVLQHGNHPAIVIWGVFNECASDTDEGRVMYQDQIQRIRQLDPSRPVTYASHHRDRDRCWDLVDIVSFNLYPLWYTEETPEALFALARKWADAAGGKDKPMIISEMGADGFYGFRQELKGHGSEERQAEILQQDIAAVQHLGLAGMFIWQFADCRVSEARNWLFSRAMGQNSKGVLDRYRRPKLAYAAVKRGYRLSEQAVDNSPSR